MDPQQLMMLLMQQSGMPQQPQAMFGAWSRPPMIGGVPVQPSQMFDLSGIPGFSGNSASGQMMGMLMQGILPGMMGPNFMPGQFAPTQNFFDHRFALNYFMQRRRAMEMASSAEADTYFRMVRGMSRMMGVEYEPGGQQEQMARRLGQDVSAMMPIFADFLPPDVLDRMHGARGSRIGLVRGIFEGGRYNFDPTSGRLGFSGESAAAVSNEVFDILYGRNSNLSAMRGLGAGRVGQLYDELTRRGMGPQSFVNEAEARSALRRELGRPTDQIASPELRRLLEQPGATPDNVLAGMNPQAFDAAMRSYDASRTARTLQQMAGAVSAMRDIFGDMGRPNAPMVELLNGLQALTQGGMSHMTPGQLETSVRQTYALARHTGMGLEVLQGFAGSVAQQLQPFGMGALAPGIARDMAAFGFAFGRRERPIGMNIFDPETATQIHGQLVAQAARSPLAVRMAAFMQLADSFARPDGGTGFAGGTEAAAIAAAIRAGETSYDARAFGGGAAQSVFRPISELTSILSRDVPGVNTQEFIAATHAHPGAMAEIIERYGIQFGVRREQGQIDRGEFVHFLASGAASGLLSTGVPANRRGRVSAQIGEAIFQESQRIADTNPELMSAQNIQSGALYRALAARVAARLGPEALAGISESELINIIRQSWTQADSLVRTSPNTAGWRDLRNRFILNSRSVSQLQQRTHAETQAIAGLQQTLSSVGQSSLVARISDYLQDVGAGGGTVEDFLFRSLGGIPTPDVVNAGQALLTQLETLSNDARSAPTEQRRAAALAQIRALGPDISQLIESGSTANLSENARQIVARTATAPNTEARRQFTGAAQNYFSVVDRLVRSRAPVAAAQARVDAARRRVQDAGSAAERSAAETELRAAEDNLARERAFAERAVSNSPEVVAAREQMEASRSGLNSQQGNIGSPIREPSLDDLRRLDLSRRLGAARDRAIEQMGPYQEATQNLSTAQRLLEEARAGGVPSNIAWAERNYQQAIQAQQDAFNSGVSQLNGSPNMAVPAQREYDTIRREMDAARRIGTAPGSPGASGQPMAQDVRIQGNTLTVTTGQTTIPDARVEIHARSVQLMEDASVSADHPGDEANSGLMGRLVGELRLLGLDRVLIDASTTATDPRSLA